MYFGHDSKLILIFFIILFFSGSIPEIIGCVHYEILQIFNCTEVNVWDSQPKYLYPSTPYAASISSLELISRGYYFIFVHSFTNLYVGTLHQVGEI